MGSQAHPRVYQPLHELQGDTVRLSQGNTHLRHDEDSTCHARLQLQQLRQNRLRVKSEPTSSSQRACWSSCFNRGSSGSSTSRPLPRSNNACSLEESGIWSDSATWARSWKSSTFSSNSWELKVKHKFCGDEKQVIYRGKVTKRKETLSLDYISIKELRGLTLTCRAWLMIQGSL